jgi:hypothetical protein
MSLLLPGVQLEKVTFFLVDSQTYSSGFNMSVAPSHIPSKKRPLIGGGLKQILYCLNKMLIYKDNEIKTF